MAEILVSVSAAAMVGGSWYTYAWGRKTVQRLNKGQPSQILRALLVMCIYVTALPGITFGGGNYWLAWMITIPFTIIMAIWLANIASLVVKRRAPAMTSDQVTSREYVLGRERVARSLGLDGMSGERWRHATARPTTSTTTVDVPRAYTIGHRPLPDGARAMRVKNTPMPTPAATASASALGVTRWCAPSSVGEAGSRPTVMMATTASPMPT